MVRLLSFITLSGLAAAVAATVSPSGSPLDMTAGTGGTYPRATKLANGNFLGVHTAFINGNNVLEVSTYNPATSTWSQTGSVAQRPSATSDLDNPFALQLPSGTILCAFRNHDKSNGVYTFYRITISKSDDNGATWTFLSQPASDPEGPNGNWEPFLRNAQDGTLQLYYSRENAADDQDSLMRTSTDGGLTWSTATTISGSGITSRDGMVGVTTVSGQNAIAVFESEVNGIFTVHSITSTNDGASWGNRQLVYTATGTNNNAGAPQVITVGSTVVVSFMTDEDTSEHAWVSGASAKLVTAPVSAVSTTGATTWGNKVQAFGVQANWPGMVTLDSSSFLYMADNGGAKSQKMVIS